MTLKLLDLERSAPEPVEFPNGHIYTVRPLDPAGYELLEEVQRTRDNARAVDLLRYLMPDVTDADLALLTGNMITGIILDARHQVDVVLTALAAKNGDAPAATTAGPRRRSKRKTPSARSSPG